MILKAKQEEEEQKLEKEREIRERQAAATIAGGSDLGESETDDESSDEDDYGPSPAAGVWAGSKRLEAESEAIAEGDVGFEDTDERPNKKQRAH